MAKKATKKAAASTRVVEAHDKKYELALVLQPELLESAVEKKLKEFEKFITDNKGVVDMKDAWGKRKLAYKIGPHSEGIYVVYDITLPNTFNKELDDHLRIDKDVLRFLHMTLKEDYQYEKFEEEPPAKEEKPKRETRESAKKAPTTHKAASKKVTETEVKDKGKKADAEKLDDKLDKLLEGDDLNI